VRQVVTNTADAMGEGKGKQKVGILDRIIPISKKGREGGGDVQEKKKKKKVLSAKGRPGRRHFFVTVEGQGRKKEASLKGR